MGGGFSGGASNVVLERTGERGGFLEAGPAGVCCNSLKLMASVTSLPGTGREVPK